MRTAIIVVFLLTCFASSNAQQQDTKHKDKPTGKFGDLTVTVSEFVLFPPQNSRATLEAFVTVANSGKGVICASLDATLNTTFGLRYLGSLGQAPRMKEMLPGESTKGTYAFDVKDGVKPVELVFRLGNSGHSIRCGSAAPVQDASLPNEIHLDVRDLPLTPPLPTSR